MLGCFICWIYILFYFNSWLIKSSFSEQFYCCTYHELELHLMCDFDFLMSSSEWGIRFELLIIVSLKRDEGKKKKNIRYSKKCVLLFPISQESYRKPSKAIFYHTRWTNWFWVSASLLILNMLAPFFFQDFWDLNGSCWRWRCFWNDSSG